MVFKLTKKFFKINLTKKFFKNFIYINVLLDVGHFFTRVYFNVLMPIYEEYYI